MSIQYHALSMCRFAAPYCTPEMRDTGDLDDSEHGGYIVYALISYWVIQKQVMEKCGGSRGVEESIFQRPNKLHLTLCVMVLADERERQQALDVLGRCPPEVIR